MGTTFTLIGSRARKRRAAFSSKLSVVPTPLSNLKLTAKETKWTSYTLRFLRLWFQNMISGPLSYRGFRETGPRPLGWRMLFQGTLAPTSCSHGASTLTTFTLTGLRGRKISSAFSSNVSVVPTPLSNLTFCKILTSAIFISRSANRMPIHWRGPWLKGM